MRWQGGAEEAGALAAEAAMAVVGVDTTAARMGSMEAALVTPVRRVPIRMDIHRAVQEASTNPPILEIATTTTNHRRNITVTTNHPRSPEVPTEALQAIPVQLTSRRTTTSTTQTRKLRNRRNTTKRIRFRP